VSRAWVLRSAAGLLGLSGLLVALLLHAEVERTRAKLARAEREIERRRAAPAGPERPCLEINARAATPVVARAGSAELPEARATELAALDLGVEVPDEEPPDDALILFEYEQAFLAQAADRNFQRIEETRLSQALAALLDKADRSDGVACRSTTCRTRLLLADEASYRAFMSRFGESAPPWLGETMLRREPSDGGRVALWIYYRATGSDEGAEPATD
jgi:hypothetical protein